MSKIIGSHIPAQIKNLAINGGLDYWQEYIANGGAAITINTAITQSAYSSDMFVYQSVGPTNKNYSLTRSTTVPTFTQSGFQSTYSNLFTMITGIASPAAGDYVSPFEYRMEGLDYEKIHGKTITIGFWMIGSVAGIYNVSFHNGATNRTYLTTVTLNGANTYEFKTVTLTLDNSGTWVFNSGIGLSVKIGAYGGTTYQSGVANTWSSGFFVSHTSATNWMATNGATLRITQFSIVEGPLGLGSVGFSRAGDGIQSELALCMRYWEKGNVVLVAGLTSGSQQAQGAAQFIIPKRASAGVVVYSDGGKGSPNTVRNANNGATLAATASPYADGTGLGILAGSATSNINYTCYWEADARL